MQLVLVVASPGIDGGSREGKICPSMECADGAVAQRWSSEVMIISNDPPTWMKDESGAIQNRLYYNYLLLFLNKRM